MKFKIAKLPGDGIGPEIVEQAVKVINAIGKKYNHQFSFEFGIVGAAAIEEAGDPYPEHAEVTFLPPGRRPGSTEASPDKR